MITRHLILVSNQRARCAVIIARRCRGDLGAMAELRDALNQRQRMRDGARFSLWYMFNEEKLRGDFNRFLARHRFAFGHGDTDKAFAEYVKQQHKERIK